MIADKSRAFPCNVQVFLYCQASNFPFFLGFNRFVNDCFPINAILGDFYFFTRNALLFRIFIRAFLRNLRRLSLFARRLITHFTRAFRGLRIRFLQDRASNLPFILGYSSFLHFTLPEDGIYRFFMISNFCSFTGCNLLIGVILFRFLRYFRVLLIASVCNYENDFRAYPSFITWFLNCQPYVAGFLVWLLWLVRD